MPREAARGAIVTMFAEDTGTRKHEIDSEGVSALFPTRPLQRLKTLQDPTEHRSCAALPGKRWLVEDIGGARSEWEQHGDTKEAWCSKVRDL